MADFILGTSLTLIAVFLAKSTGHKDYAYIIGIYGTAEVSCKAIVAIREFANVCALGFKESWLYKLGEFIAWITECF